MRFRLYALVAILVVLLVTMQEVTSDGSEVSDEVQAEVEAIMQKEAAAAAVSVDGEATPADAAAAAAKEEEEKRPKKYKKSTKDWNRLNMDDVDKKWEGSDDPEELEHEFEHIRKVSEKVMRKKQMNVDFDNPEHVKKLIKNPEAIMALKAGGGGSMLFVDLHDLNPEGNAWSKEEEDKLANKYTALMRTNGLMCNMFNIGANDKNEEAHRFLAQVDRGWQTMDIIKFLLTQREVKEATLDSKKYIRSDFPSLMENEDDD